MEKSPAITMEKSPALRQGWSRKKKEAIISGDWEKLSFLARRNKNSLCSVQDPTLRDACSAKPRASLCSRRTQGERIREKWLKSRMSSDLEPV